VSALVSPAAAKTTENKTLFLSTVLSKGLREYLEYTAGTGNARYLDRIDELFLFVVSS
jgi:hypothetical protein